MPDALYIIILLLSSARKRDHELKKDETGYLATDKKFYSAFECKIQV